MPSATNISGSPGSITREMLFDLMVLARDTSFPDAQIRAICDTVTQVNVGNSIELLRRLHASQDTSLVVASKPSPVQSVASVQHKPQIRPFPNASSEPGAALCAETFYKLCNDDRLKLQRLSAFCPFTLAFRKCPHSDRCQLIHICWNVHCLRGRTCMFSHQVIPTCDSVLDGTRCSRSRRLVAGKSKACPRNHDYKVRILMGAMRVPHELGFYGLSDARSDAHAQINNAPSTEPDVVADWMAADVESPSIEHVESPSTEHMESPPNEHNEVVTVADVEERELDDGFRAQSLQEDTTSGTDLILFF